MNDEDLLKSQFLIGKGDFVSVNFHGAQFTLCKKGKVLFAPAMPGDNWIIMDEATGVIHYISEPCTITRQSKAENWP